ncbi:sugar transferase [Carnobacterium maltaromaticum]|uniref:sugar transferase n=1 Tax=Carnobacterium maltaromaticum TaxID=2751 RepID=UPI00298AF17C|nr:sugar transferase [Carnobacterium maltaromaticum]MDW5525415.1 sugar transferase [Carnobacterium maltaromaticum]
MYINYYKRFIDLVISFFGLVVLFPVFIVLVSVIKIDSSGPVIYKQKRIGKDLEKFNIYKFRTMRIGTPEKATHLLENPAEHITRVGKFLRKSSLDELPQIFNILLGDMSIIGPRPALWNQYDLIQEREKLGVNKIKPGLTGLAQINGRDELEIKKKVNYDKKYMDEISFLVDLKIFYKTFLNVISKAGIKEGKN